MLIFHENHVYCIPNLEKQFVIPYFLKNLEKFWLSFRSPCRLGIISILTFFLLPWMCQPDFAILLQSIFSQFLKKSVLTWRLWGGK